MNDKRADFETEISSAGEVPLIPNVRPVIILSGSDYNMGYQYYRQLIQIFGPWILDGVAQDTFTDEELANLKAFQHNIRQYTPEFIDFFKGMAAGATDAGVPLSYEEVLAAFTSTESYPGAPSGSEDEELPPAECSGWAAWGSATKDGKLICGGQGESAMRFAVTIIAFPKEGNRFIHSPSSVDRTELMGFKGRPFWGFPSMNNTGLAFVHHFIIVPNLAAHLDFHALFLQLLGQLNHALTLRLHTLCLGDHFIAAVAQNPAGFVPTHVILVALFFGKSQHRNQQGNSDRQADGPT